MAEVVTGKKGAPRVDMTPMVDLGFLLITFFMLTTTMSQQAGMDIQMPFDDGKNKENTKIKESNALTILLGKNNKVFYYQGLNEPELKLTTFKPDGIRKLLMQKKAEIGEKMFVLIKPLPKSTYQNIVDILDELAITAVPSYTLTKVAKEDQELVFKNGYTEESDE
jgi:biopolymer transport protein ExbD